MTTETPTPAPAAAAAPAPAAPATVMFIGKIVPACKKEDVNAFVESFKPKRVYLRRIKKFRRAPSAQCAFVEFENAETTTKAIQALNGKELCGAPVVVEAARRPIPPMRRRRFYRKDKKAAPAAGAPAAAGTTPAATTAPAGTEEKKGRFQRRRFQRRPRRQPAADAPLSKDVAYVGNLPYIVDEEGMKDIFEGCKFIEARVVRRNRDGRSKGFGFVTFANEEDRAAAIKVADGSVVEGRQIRVSPARERVEKPKAEEAAPAAN